MSDSPERTRVPARFARVLDQYVLEKRDAEMLYLDALEALEDGLDSPSLRMLSACEGCDRDYLRNLLRKAMQELGISMPNQEEACFRSALDVCRDIVAGRVTPYEGARTIWWKITPYCEDQRLLIFVGLASEYEDCEQFRDAYAMDIVDQARKLIQEHEASAS